MPWRATRDSKSSSATPCALPYPDGHFDTAVCVRVLHHFADPGPVLAELGRVTRPGGVVVLEYANKRNLKSIARRVLGRQSWSPFELGSVEYKPFHFDHAPVGIRRALRRAGLRIERCGPPRSSACRR